LPRDKSVGFQADSERPYRADCRHARAAGPQQFASTQNLDVADPRGELRTRIRIDESAGAGLAPGRPVPLA